MSGEKYKYQIRATTKFKKATRLAAKRGKDTDKLKNIVEKRAKGEPLDAALRDHSLSGNWSNHRELHIEPDWLLIYRIEENILILELLDTGSHADLFKQSAKIVPSPLSIQPICFAKNVAEWSILN